MRSHYRESHAGISLGRMSKHRIIYLMYVMLNITYNGVSSNSNKRHSKRQFIDNPLKIDHWSGPFFSEEQQANAFNDIVRQLKGEGAEEVTASKRMELKGIDPRKILNPIPILEKRKIAKDEGPVAETYVGKNPFADHGVEISPQERLANLVSEPIIHELMVQPARKKSKSDLSIDLKKSVQQQQQLNQQEPHQQLMQQEQEREHQLQQRQKGKNQAQEQQQHHQQQQRQQRQQYQKLASKKFGKLNQIIGSHEIQQLLFHKLPEYNKFSDQINYFDNHEGYSKEDESNTENLHSLGKSRHRFAIPFGKHHGNSEGRNYKADEDHEHLHEDEEGEEHEDEEHDDGDHENYDHDEDSDHDHDHGEEEEEDGDYHEGDYHHGHHDEDDEHEDEHRLRNEGNHAFDYDTSNEKLNNEIENELSIHRANEPRPVFRDDQVENQYEKDVNHFTPSLEQDNKRTIQQNKRSKIHKIIHGASKSKYSVRLVGKTIAKKHHMSKSSSINNTPAEKSLSTTRGDSDIHAPEGSPIADAGVGLSSHSGVLDQLPGVMSQSEIPKIGSQQPLPLHDDSTVASRVLSGETLFQLPKVDNHSSSDMQVKEDVDTETIYVHHHKGNKKKTETNKQIKSAKRFKLKKSTLNKTILNKRSHNDYRNAHMIGNDINGRRRDAIVKPSNKKRWSHSINHHGGILEDNVNEEFHGPHLMRVGLREGVDLHKDWNNLHSPGNGFYNGRGVGPARFPDSDYLSHNQHTSAPNLNGGDYFEGADSPVGQVGTHVGPLGSHSLNPHTIQFDPVHSLSASDSHADHETAGIIDAIWEHDYEGHVGRNHDRRKEGMLGFFEHNDQNALLPAETLDGIAEHWERGHHGNHIFDGENVPQAVVHNTEVAHSRFGSLQDIQDDPSIDSDFQTAGIGTPMNSAHHIRHGGHIHSVHHGTSTPFVESHHVGEYDSQLHSHPLSLFGDHNNHLPEDLQIDAFHHHEMSPEEYHNQIDALMLKYHQLEENMKGQNGELLDHLDVNLLNHHSRPNYHSGYDVYAYKNPWTNAKLPYHVPVENHPQDAEEGEVKIEAKPEIKIEAKTEAKTEGKNDSPEQIPTDKGGQEKAPSPVNVPNWDGSTALIPAQRGGPEQSGSIGLISNGSLLTDAIKANIKNGDLTSLKQGIAAFKTLNMTVPAEIQIEELKAELKEAKEKSKTEDQLKLENPSTPSNIAALLSSPVELPQTSIANPTNPMSALQEFGAVKGKKPEQQVNQTLPVASKPNLDSAEVTKMMRKYAEKTVSETKTEPLKEKDTNSINTNQEAFLKQMLEKAEAINKQNEIQSTDQNKDIKNTTRASDSLPLLQNLPLEMSKEALMKNSRLLQFLQPDKILSTSSSKDSAFNMKNFEPLKANGGMNTLFPFSGNKSPIPAQNPVLEKLLDDLILKTQKEKELKSDTLGKSLPGNADAASLETDESLIDTSKMAESNDLINLLNRAALLKKSRRRKKKSRKQTEIAYSRIGYEEPVDNVDGSKKNLDSMIRTASGISKDTVKSVEKVSLNSHPSLIDQSENGEDVTSKRKRTNKRNHV